MPLMSLAVRRSSHVCLSQSHRGFFLKWRSMVAVPFGWCNPPKLVQGCSKLRRVFNRRSGNGWMAANVAVAQDPAGNLEPAKDKSTERIDGIVAIIMAIGRAMVVQEEPQPSYQMFIL
jgi:Phage Terminase